MGVDLDAQPVADDQQRRVVERQRVHHQLAQRTVERLAGRLVFLREVAALEHVGKAALLAEREGALLEHVVFAAHRGRHAEHGAEFNEVLSRALPFVEAVTEAACAPFA